MLAELTLSTEVWVALVTLVAGPLATAAATNLSLSREVKLLSTETKALREDFVTRVASIEGRVVRLESKGRRK